MVEYFYEHHFDLGLHHLSIAADAGHKESVYLYGIILLCKGMTEAGRAYVNKLNWAQDTTTMDNCWNNIMISIHGLRAESITIEVNRDKATSSHVEKKDKSADTDDGDIAMAPRIGCD